MRQVNPPKILYELTEILRAMVDLEVTGVGTLLRAHIATL
jgi:hypothetical protein